MALQISVVKEKTLISCSQASHSLERWVLMHIIHACIAQNYSVTFSLYSVCLK